MTLKQILNQNTEEFNTAVIYVAINQDIKVNSKYILIVYMKEFVITLTNVVIHQVGKIT